jgi:hypothetical protein
MGQVLESLLQSHNKSDRIIFIYLQTYICKWHHCPLYMYIDPQLNGLDASRTSCDITNIFNVNQI